MYARIRKRVETKQQEKQFTFAGTYPLSDTRNEGMQHSSSPHPTTELVQALKTTKKHTDKRYLHVCEGYI
ncbi:hypothetical protein QQG55_5640 [Brugia pahangi]